MEYSIINFLPLIIVSVAFAIGIFFEYKRHQRIDKKAKDDPQLQEKLDILYTQYDSKYTSNYNKKLKAILKLILFGLIIGVLIYTTYTMPSDLINVDKLYQIYEIIITILVIGILLFSFWKPFNHKTKKELNVELFYKKKYPTSKFHFINEEQNMSKIVYIVEIDEYNCFIENSIIYKKYLNQDGNLEKIEYRNILTYEYDITKNLNFDYVNSFKNIPELQNKYLIHNIRELSKSRFLSMKASNNKFYIRKMIKNSEITEKDIKKDIDDIKIFKDEIIKVIDEL